MLKTKLAGSQTKLAAAIASVLDETHEKMKLAAEADEKKDSKAKKLLKYEEKEHGHIPSPAEEEKEHKNKESSAIDPTDPEEVTKLAAALEEAADLLEKEADVTEMGAESHQGGQVLPVQSPSGGTQPVPSKGKKTIKAKSDGKPSDSTAAGEIVGTDVKDRPSLHQKMSDKVLKTAGANLEALKAAVEKTAAEYGEAEKKEHKRIASGGSRVAGALGGGHGAVVGAVAGHRLLGKKLGGKAGAAAGALGGAALGYASGKATGYAGLRGANRIYRAVGKDTDKAKEKASGALAFVISKLSGADLGGEAKQGGETLASTLKPTMQPGRSLIQNAQNLKNVTKPEAKAPRKAELAQVLSESDSKHGVADNIHGNLRSASKGGVKTAAAKVLLAKIAEEGCTCKDGTCRHCKLKKAAAEMKQKISSAKTDAQATA